MTNKKILFRADGNSSTGLGHLYRLFALVEMLKAEYNFTFLTTGSSTLSVFPSEYKPLIIPANISLEDEPEWIKENFNSDENIIIADGYDFNSSYQKQIHDLGFKLIFIDDLVKEHMYADLVINHAINVSNVKYKSEKYTQFALGTQFAILRPQFLNAIHKNRLIEKVENVFVCFGGADPSDFTLKTIDVLLHFNQIKTINIVLGGAYKHTLVEERVKLDPKIHIHRNLGEKELIEIMEDSQLAIVPSSTILYEVCAVKMIVLSGYFVDNQKGIYEGFLSRNAIIGLNDLNKITSTEMSKQIEKTLNNPPIPMQLKNQKEIFDNNIKSRFLNRIESLC